MDKAPHWRHTADPLAEQAKPTFQAIREDLARVPVARRIATRTTPVAAALTAAFVAWTLVDQSDRGGVQAVSAALGIVAILSLAYAAVVAKSASARAFGASCVGILGLFTALFVDLFPNAMVSSTSEAFNLTLAEASSSDYTLTVMTVVAVILVPVVVATTVFKVDLFASK